ncbi:hypothetical protein HWV62_26769 [Athelia sp. TMB]|nr:hypothetical protein HWV62_26769 [Athelia sp. TMB]
MSSPHFRLGPRHIDGKGLSPCARDSHDWAGYYLNRFVDRDMVMRFHWGLGVGHVYTHHSTCKNASVYKKWPSKAKTTSNHSTHDSATHAGLNESLVEDDSKALERETSQTQCVEKDDGSDSEDEKEVEEGNSDDCQDEDDQEDLDSGDEEELLFHDMYGYIDSDGDGDEF